MYKIKNLQKRNAKKIGVVIKPSTLKGKKIEVIKIMLLGLKLKV